MRNCNKSILVLFLIFGTKPVFAQKAADTAKINFIKAQFSEINKNLKSYKKIEKEDIVESTDGNKVQLYFKGNKIKKIAVSYYGESGQVLNEFYFSDKKLIFCYFISYHYNMPYYEKGGGKVAATKEERLYLSDGKIFLIKKKHIGRDFVNEFPDDPQKEAKRLLNLK